MCNNSQYFGGVHVNVGTVYLKHFSEYVLCMNKLGLMIQTKQSSTRVFEYRMKNTQVPKVLELLEITQVLEYPRNYREQYYSTIGTYREYKQGDILKSILGLV